MLSDLVLRAVAVRARAYAPYSQFRVGAALRLKDGRVFEGVNVENCSYGLTICAERNAVAQAVAAGAVPGDVAEVAIVADAATPARPCGACRQVLAEFADSGARLLLHNVRDGATDIVTLGTLLPQAFTPKDLVR